MTPEIGTSLSARIREDVQKNEAVRQADLVKQVNLARMAALLDHPAAGKSRIKAHKGQLANRKERTGRRRKAARRSLARSRR